MNRDKLIKDFYDLFIKVKAQASFLYALPKAEADILLEKLQNKLKLINENLDVCFNSKEGKTTDYLFIIDDGSDEAVAIADEIQEKAPYIQNWEILRINNQSDGIERPILEYRPNEDGLEEDNETSDPFLKDVYISLIPVNSHNQEAKFNVNIFMNEMDSENSRGRLKCLIPMLLGATRYTQWINSIEFHDNKVPVPPTAIPYFRSDLWIKYMENY
jgi:hypothetical protein